MTSNDGVFVSGYDRLWAKLVYRRGGPLRPVVQILLRLVGVDIPRAVEIGPGLKLLHVGSGHTLHRSVELGANVVLGPGVVLGKRDLWSAGTSNMRIVVGDHVVIGAGAAVLAGDGHVLTIGEGAVVGANAVLTRSIGAGEIWAGAPARHIGQRGPVTDLDYELRAASFALREAGLPPDDLHGGPERGWWLASTDDGEPLALTVDGRPMVKRSNWEPCTGLADQLRLLERATDYLQNGPLA